MLLSSASMASGVGGAAGCAGGARRRRGVGRLKGWAKVYLGAGGCGRLGVVVNLGLRSE